MLTELGSGRAISHVHCKKRELEQNENDQALDGAYRLPARRHLPQIAKCESHLRHNVNLWSVACLIFPDESCEKVSMFSRLIATFRHRCEREKVLWEIHNNWILGDFCSLAGKSSETLRVTVRTRVSVEFAANGIFSRKKKFFFSQIQKKICKRGGEWDFSPFFLYTTHRLD